MEKVHFLFITFSWIKKMGEEIKGKSGPTEQPMLCSLEGRGRKAEHNKMPIPKIPCNSPPLVRVTCNVIYLSPHQVKSGNNNRNWKRLSPFSVFCSLFRGGGTRFHKNKSIRFSQIMHFLSRTAQGKEATRIFPLGTKENGTHWPLPSF